MHDLIVHHAECWQKPHATLSSLNLALSNQRTKLIKHKYIKVTSILTE